MLNNTVNTYFITQSVSVSEFNYESLHAYFLLQLKVLGEKTVMVLIIVLNELIMNMKYDSKL